MVKSTIMFLQRHIRLLFARLLLAVILLQALLPAWAATQSVGQASWIEICVSTGIKWVKIADANHSATEVASDPCQFCVATGAAPEFDVRPYLLTSLAFSLPSVISFASVTTAFPGHDLQSRAPPSFS